MRKWLLIGMTAVAATVAVLPVATASAAPAAKHDVLTISKANGTAVKAKAILKASLKPKTKAVFTTKLGTLSCKKSTVTEKVTKNVTAPGTATLSLTGQSFSSCTLSISGAKLKSLKLNKLPYKVTFSDKKKSHPVTVAKPSVSFSATDIGITVACTYTAKSITGSTSNKTHLITFSKVKFGLAPGSNGFCSKTGTFTATYGPVKDTSVKHSPTVFVS
jgi:hypothetical protein